MAGRGTKKRACVTAAVVLLLLLSSCAGSAKNALKEFPPADMSGYAGLAGYEKELRFADMTVADTVRLMDEGATFAVLLSFADCPWCNATVVSINDAATEAGQTVGNIDTRKNPAWKNNTEIDDYDLFVERFGEFLEEDEIGLPHLYVPYIFYIRGGTVVYAHQGALPELGDEPPANMTDKQREALTDIYREGFRKLNGE